jgi:hypothetical protein
MSLLRQKYYNIFDKYIVLKDISRKNSKFIIQKNCIMLHKKNYLIGKFRTIHTFKIYI